MDKVKLMTEEERKEIFNAVQSQQNKDILDALEDAKKVIKGQRVLMDTKKAEATGSGPMDQDKDNTPAVANEKV